MIPESMQYSYTKLQVQPFANSTRQITVFRPIVPVTIMYRQKLVQFAALVDSGADFNVFHGDIAVYLGIKLTAGSKRTIGGISGQIKGYEHSVRLKIDKYTFRSKIIFSNQLPDNALAVLGNVGFFDRFEVTFDYAKRSFDLLRRSKQ